MNENKIREFVREFIQNNLNEISTTAGVPGYLTPNAFAGDKKSRSAFVKRMASAIGYELTKRGKEEPTKGDRLAENYYQYRNDPERQPHQKIGAAISEVNKQLQVIEKVIKMNGRLQKEFSVTDDKLWKRTRHQMVKLEGRLIELAGKLREMRG